jgi:tRNA(Ile)-lysidine synthase
MMKIVKPSEFSIGEVIAVSGGADSVYLLFKFHEKSKSAILAHINYGARGKDSEEDQEFVEQIGRSKGMSVEVRKISMAKNLIGFENNARNIRYAFLLELKKKQGAEKILIAHTADDQVETILMRILEGAGISGLKGIPRKTDEGIERPLLDTWREDILKYLHEHKIPYRVDKSNFDTRFERNWIRHVLIPLLGKRYGKEVKKRIFALGERFREIDEFLGTAARRWMKRNLKGEKTGGRVRTAEGAGGEDRLKFRRKPYVELPAALRKRILQNACFERVGIAPNERLLESMDRLVLSGGPSSRLKIGKGAVLRTRYGEAILEGAGKGEPPAQVLKMEKRGKIPPPALKKMTKGERAAVFDADSMALPVAVRPLRAGDRIRPFGLDAEKKVKEILIDRKVPREERWGRPAVCDAEGRILWIPGVVRSAIAPITRSTKQTMILRLGETPE